MPRYVAGTRLHFGLLHVPIPGQTHWPDGTRVRKFGGVGLMLNEPQIELDIEPAEHWHANGNLGTRALTFAQKLTNNPFHIIANGPAEHTGLGVGTALGLTVTHAITEANTATDLARFSGRGERSGIGLHGYLHGGLILDGGKVQDEPPELIEAIPFPKQWRVVLIQPETTNDLWSGDRERAAFARPRSESEAFNNYCQLVVLQKQIGLEAKAVDFGSFSNAVYEFNKLAGAPFAEDQGGPYASAAIQHLIEKLRAMGVQGVGQSSWGPTVFAFVETQHEAERLVQTWGGNAKITQGRRHE